MGSYAVGDFALELQSPNNAYLGLYGGMNGSNRSNFFFLISPVFDQAGFYSNASGTGTTLPIVFNVDGNEGLRIATDGSVGIGMSNPAHELDINGTARANEIIVETGGADFVFEDNYDLRPLEEVERYIGEHGHLPEIPSAAEMQANGAKLGKMQTKLLQKIEELTLYIIEQKKQIETLNETLRQLQADQATSLHH